MNPAALMERVRSEQGRRALRYSAVSVVNVPLGQGILFLGQHAFGWSPRWANFVAVMVTAIPAYLLNRYWVWGRKDHNRLLHEVIPFWLIALLGLVLSDMAVRWVTERTDWPPAANVASISAFGVLWILKYLLLDRVLFGRGHHHPPELDEPELPDDELVA